MALPLRREGKLDVHGKNRLNEDNCEKLFTTKQSESPGIYHLTQYRDCECGVPQVVETAVENPMIQFRDGYGISECFMDEQKAKVLVCFRDCQLSKIYSALFSVFKLFSSSSSSNFLPRQVILV